ncbi:glycoside hydrolase family 71 [Pyrrhoderma noxium]|uniref:Glycoside hydrolase family 71 n=1 Tax=Pyrrhoderma noxium TaxID=2282107 RepID=A0A286UXJ2_9AGAM|nr:glycoside hydrolase family 71 [Pyrrhoderma noxium]
MASVSPWFFTHYGEESWNKNWIYRCDDWLFVRRWMQLIDELHFEVDIVQILSWNDYGESHYIGPIKGAQPNSEDWVDGFSHLSWLDLCSHFMKLFKPKFRAGPTSGSNLLLREWARHNYQSQHYQQQEEQQQQSRTRHHHYHHHSHHREQGRGITYEMDVDEDRIYAWGRSHPRDAVARSDSVGKPKGWQLTDDRFWVVIFAKQDAEVLLWSSSDSDSESATNDGISLHSERRRKKDVHCHHPVPRGLSTYSCQLVPGGGMHVQLSRDDVVIKQYHSSSEEFTFQKEPRKYNFNAFVGMA